MQFIVIGRAVDAAPVPVEQALGAYKASFEQLAAGKDGRVKGVWPYADDKATVMLIEANTAEELSETLTGLPGYMLSTWESHPVTSAAYVVEELNRIEATLTGANR